MFANNLLTTVTYALAVVGLLVILSITIPRGQTSPAFLGGNEDSDLDPILFLRDYHVGAVEGARWPSARLLVYAPRDCACAALRFTTKALRHRYPEHVAVSWLDTEAGSRFDTTPAGSEPPTTVAGTNGTGPGSGSTNNAVFGNVEEPRVYINGRRLRQSPSLRALDSAVATALRR